MNRKHNRLQMFQSDGSLIDLMNYEDRIQYELKRVMIFDIELTTS